jgi:hypothetical protein
MLGTTAGHLQNDASGNVTTDATTEALATGYPNAPVLIDGNATDLSPRSRIKTKTLR